MKQKQIADQGVSHLFLDIPSSWTYLTQVNILPLFCTRWAYTAKNDLLQSAKMVVNTNHSDIKFWHSTSVEAYV